jgi:hypothetical protein
MRLHSSDLMHFRCQLEIFINLLIYKQKIMQPAVGSGTAAPVQCSDCTELAQAPGQQARLLHRITG